MADGLKFAPDKLDKVNTSLPLKLDSKDVQHNEQFVQLLSRLTEHLSDSGMSTAVKEELVQARENVAQEKLGWLKLDALHTELTELLIEQQTKSDCNPATLQFYEAASESLAMAETIDYIHCHPDPTSNLTLLGLKAEDIARKNPHLKYMTSMQQKLIPELEARLRTRMESIVSVHDSASAGTETSTLMFAKAKQFPELLQSEKLKREMERGKLKKYQVIKEKQIHQYHQVLLETLELLQKLIVNHRLQSKADNDAVTSEWLTTRCDAMCLKISLLELQLLCDTYSAEAVSALTCIREQLDTKVSSTEQELTQVEQSLDCYALVGSEFEALVREYTELREEIDNKQWGLKELQQSLNT